MIEYHQNMIIAFGAITAIVVYYIIGIPKQMEIEIRMDKIRQGWHEDNMALRREQLELEEKHRQMQAKIIALFERWIGEEE